MNYEPKPDWILISVLAFVALIFAALMAVGWVTVTQTQTCHAHGFSGWDDGYCIKRVNGTDSVVSVKALR